MSLSVEQPFRFVMLVGIVTGWFNGISHGDFFLVRDQEVSAGRKRKKVMQVSMSEQVLFVRTETITGKGSRAGSRVGD